MMGPSSSPIYRYVSPHTEHFFSMSNKQKIIPNGKKNMAHNIPNAVGVSRKVPAWK